jgi:hypothetical protein
MGRKVHKIMLQDWQIMKLQSKAKCPECGRVFNLTNEEDASEFYNGHDCEE